MHSALSIKRPGYNILMPHVLSYSRPLQRDPGPADPDSLWRPCIAPVPLGLGVADFLAWLPTHWIPLAFAGFWVILLGLVMFVIGGICLLAYLGGRAARRSRARSHDPRPRHRRRLSAPGQFSHRLGIILAVQAIDPRFFD